MTIVCDKCSSKDNVRHCEFLSKGKLIFRTDLCEPCIEKTKQFVNTKQKLTFLDRLARTKFGGG